MYQFVTFNNRRTTIINNYNKSSIQSSTISHFVYVIFIVWQRGIIIVKINIERSKLYIILNRKRKCKQQKKQ